MMFKFLRTTALWILLAPTALNWIGAASNQVVLYANHDTFPVSINPIKLQKFTGGEPSPDPTDPTGGRTIASGGHVFVLPDGEVLMDETHCVMTEKTHLNWLADVFDFHDSIQSIGDLLLDLGDWTGSFALYVYIFVVSAALLRKERS